MAQENPQEKNRFQLEILDAMKKCVDRGEYITGIEHVLLEPPDKCPAIKYKTYRNVKWEGFQPIRCAYDIFPPFPRCVKKCSNCSIQIKFAKLSEKLRNLSNAKETLPDCLSGILMDYLYSTKKEFRGIFRSKENDFAIPVYIAPRNGNFCENAKIFATKGYPFLELLVNFVYGYPCWKMRNTENRRTIPNAPEALERWLPFTDCPPDCDLCVVTLAGRTEPAKNRDREWEPFQKLQQKFIQVAQEKFRELLGDCSDKLYNIIYPACVQSVAGGEQYHGNIYNVFVELEHAEIPMDDDEYIPSEIGINISDILHTFRNIYMNAFINDSDVEEDIWGFQYSTVKDNRVREEHWLLEGVRLPKDDPFWLKYFPPNGWNCRCVAMPIGIFSNMASVDFGITGRDPRTRSDEELGPDPKFLFHPKDWLALCEPEKSEREEAKGGNFLEN